VGPAWRWSGGLGLLALGTLTASGDGLNLPAISEQSLVGAGFSHRVRRVGGLWLVHLAVACCADLARLDLCYVNPIVAVFLGNWLGAESLTPRTLIAATVIVGSVALMTIANQPVKRDA